MRLRGPSPSGLRATMRHSGIGATSSGVERCGSSEAILKRMASSSTTVGPPDSNRCRTSSCMLLATPRLIVGPPCGPDPDPQIRGGSMPCCLQPPMCRAVQCSCRCVNLEATALKFRYNPMCCACPEGSQGALVGHNFRSVYSAHPLPRLTAFVCLAPTSQVVEAYDTFCDEAGAKRANHFIATHYRDGDHSIGAHYDKDRSIEASDESLSLITVVKTGAHARRFTVARVGEEGSPFFDQAVAPGTAIIMTLEANPITLQQPMVQGVGVSG